MTQDFLDLYKGLKIYIENRSSEIQALQEHAGEYNDWAMMLELSASLEELQEVENQLDKIASSRSGCFQGEAQDTAEQQLRFVFQEDTEA